ncbi:MAG: hypothetical protein LUC38_00165 [Oscillospiraceae bacterium]|nr:hypothetical protein [Oscillospiraceae bacterium]
MKEFLKSIFHKPHMLRRVIFCVIGVTLMGFCVSWLNLLAWGTDPCSVMNLAMAENLGMSFGSWQALFNCVLFVFIAWKGRENIGIGTVCNMFIVGYACDLMTWLRETFIPDFTFEGIVQKIVACVVILFIFVFSVAVYTSVGLGASPYDSIPEIIYNAQKTKKVPFRVIRILWDGGIAVFGYLIGGTVGIVTVLMALTIGPMAEAVRKRIGRFIE